MLFRVAALLMIASLPLARQAQAQAQAPAQARAQPQSHITLDGDGLTAQAGPVAIRARFAVAVQGAVFQPAGARGAQTAGEVDGSALLNAEYEGRNGLVFGIRAEVDTGNEDIGGFERDEFFGYFVSQWGRVEVGENDGPADELSLHAPTIGLGQVRGDFARYTGSVALLSPFDSRDSFKASYYLPPISGLRLGVSYAPAFRQDQDAADPDDRTEQRNVLEFGANYTRPIGPWVLGVSGAYVTGGSAPSTEREDIRSWSTGLSASRGGWTLGGAFVQRGRSNLRATADREREWNAGVAWEGQRWRAATSYAVSLERNERNHRLGAGLEYSITRNLYIRADAVGLLEQERGDPNDFGFVTFSEIGLRF